MSDSRNPSAQSSRFAESADRLDRIVQSVRAQQTGECKGTHCVTEYRVSTFSPDEVWAKNFATHGIGPQQAGPLPFDVRLFQPLALAPAERSAQPMTTVNPAEQGPMRTQKPPRPSVLRRVLFGRNA